VTAATTPHLHIRDATTHALARSIRVEPDVLASAQRTAQLVARIRRTLRPGLVVDCGEIAAWRGERGAVEVGR